MLEVTTVGKEEETRSIAQWLHWCRTEVAAAKAEGKQSCIVKLGSVEFGDEELMSILSSEGYDVCIWTPEWATTVNVCDFRLIFRWK